MSYDSQLFSSVFVPHSPSLSHKSPPLSPPDSQFPMSGFDGHSDEDAGRSERPLHSISPDGSDVVASDVVGSDVPLVGSDVPLVSSWIVIVATFESSAEQQEDPL